MSDCDRIQLHERIPDYVHGTLDAAQRAEVDAHLAACADARAELALVRDARDAIVRRTPVVDTALAISLYAIPSATRKVKTWRCIGDSVSSACISRASVSPAIAPSSGSCSVDA